MKIFLLFIFVLIFAGFSAGAAQTDIFGKGFVHAGGENLVNGEGKIVFLKGVSLGNRVWFSQQSDLPETSESEFQDIADMGFNSVRFYLKAAWFDDWNREMTFKTIERNIAFAAKNHIRLILNIHIPPGGFQSQGKGIFLWIDRENQLKLIETWKKIAAHFKDEPAVIGYGILNEPWPTESLGQWEKLSAEIATAIREIDTNHLLIVERPIAVGKDSLGENRNGWMDFPILPDSNIMYEFHFYKPYLFTHQQAFWLPVMGGFSRYPNGSIMEIAGNFVLKNTTATNPLPLFLMTDWVNFESARFTVNDPDLKIGVPAARAENLGFLGSAWFDDIVVEEYSPEGKLTWTNSMDLNSSDFWLYFSGGGFSVGFIDPFGGTGFSPALKISGPNGSSYLAGVFHPFNLKQGYSYRIKGKIRAGDLFGKPDVELFIGFCTSDGEVRPRGKSYIEREFDRYAEFRVKVKAPVYLGEFGCIRYAYEGRGGFQWVRDVMEACRSRNIHYNFHAYKDEFFGLYITGNSSENFGELRNLFLELQTNSGEERNESK